PAVGIVFPDAMISAPLIGTVIVRIQALSDASGFIDPLSGTAYATITIRVRLINSALGSNCAITPVTATLTVFDSGGLTGGPYHQTAGTGGYVPNAFPVPGASNCGLFTSIINSQIGLPSAPPHNSVRLDTFVDPILIGSEVPAP